MIKTIWKGINKIFQKLHRKTPKFMITSYLIKTNKKKDLNFIFASLAFTIFAAVGLHSIVIKYTFLIRLRKIVFLYTYLVFFFFTFYFAYYISKDVIPFLSVSQIISISKTICLVTACYP